MAHAAMAGRCPGFDHFSEHGFDTKFKKVLKDENFDTTLRWASTFESAARTPAATLELQEMVRAFGASDEEAGGWVLQAEELYELACDLAHSAHRRRVRSMAWRSQRTLRRTGERATSSRRRRTSTSSRRRL